MDPQEWQRLKHIVGTALGTPVEAREAFLSSACGTDLRLRSEVDRLLASAAAAEDLYETPLVTIGGNPAVVVDALRYVPVAEGAMVGPYRLVGEIGSGGMGRVYLATRADGAFDQRIAVKFVSYLAGADLESRFTNERRILASLEHPNIARLLDGGSTSDGVPFLSMEYVDGTPIDEFCDTRRLDVRGRLELFRRVCAAVHYAHQRLIIHRDIKASNILVTADGTPKLLDFGIAKMLEPSDAATMPTVVRLLTPESASPEQVRGEPITIASDIYALGVLLYRLLSGQSPYGSSTRTEAALLRAISEETPIGPLAARERAGTDPWPAVAFARDLDGIVLMALRKEPARRYGSVEQFSDDLGRFLRGEPVLATPDSTVYRARKFLARHRVSGFVVAASAVAVLAGAGAAVQQASVARRERQRAEQRFNDVRRLANSFVFEFHDAIANLPGSLASRQLVVKRAAEYLDELARDATGDEAALQRELATANMRLADIMGGGGVSNLGDLDGAAARYEIAAGLFERLAARPNAERADVEGLAQVRIQQSRFLVLKGDLEESERHANDAVKLLAARAADRPANIATAYHQLGWVQARRLDRTNAVESLRLATDLASGQVDANPSDATAIARLARIATDYGQELIAGGDHAKAVIVLRDARAHLERLLAADPLNTRHRMNLVNLLNSEGDAYYAQRDHAAALDAFGQGLSTAEAMAGASPDDQGIRITVLLTRQRLAAASRAAGDIAAGIRSLRTALDEAEALIARAPKNAFVENQLAAVRVQLGAALLASDPGSREGCRTLGAGLQGWRALAARGQLPGDSGLRSREFEAQLARCER